MSTEESCPVRVTASTRDPVERFTDYIRLYGEGTKLLLVEHERELLRVGVMEFDLPLDTAKSLLHGIVSSRDIDLESQAERHLKTYLTSVQAEDKSKAALLMGDSNSIDQTHFERAVDFYQTLTRNALTREDVRKRVKLMIQRLGIPIRRDWKQMGSRKWFENIEAKQEKT